VVRIVVDSVVESRSVVVVACGVITECIVFVDVIVIALEEGLAWSISVTVAVRRDWMPSGAGCV
jgi:hypothetical protein